MAEMTDRRLEELLRSVLSGEEAILPLRLRPEDILVRQARARRGRHRLSGMRLLVVAAALILPLAGLLAVAGRPTTSPTVATTYRALILGGAATEPDASLSSDVELLLADADGEAELVATIPLSRFPKGVTPAADGWVTHAGSLGVGGPVGSTVRYAMFDLLDLDADPVVSSTDPRPVPDSLPARADTVSSRYGELRVCGGRRLRFQRPCDDRTDRAVESGHTARLRAWLPRPPGDVRYDGAAWAADGGIWVLRDDRRDGRRALSLVHVDPDGTEVSGQTFGIDAASDPDLVGLAPDDSLAVIQLTDGGSSTILLVDPRSGAAVSVAGAFVGFADAADATTLPRVARSIDRLERLPEAVDATYRDLETFDEQLAPLPAGPILLVHEGSSNGPPLEYDTGAVPYADGWVLSIECAGPGHLVAEILDVAGTDEYGSGGMDGDCLYPSEGYFGGPDPDQPDDQPHEISASVDTEGTLTWRLVVLEVPLASPGP